MRKLQGWLIGCFLLATNLCVFGQGMAYFFNEYFMPIAPIYYLTGITIIGISLYAVTAILIFLLFKKKEFVSDNKEIYLMVLSIIAPSASLWAFFVTAMWWG